MDPFGDVSVAGQSVGPTGRQLPYPAVSLLPAEVSNTIGTLPFRSTTYEPTTVTSANFQCGSVYAQNPENDQGLRDFSISDLNFSQLYTKGYRSYIKRQSQMESCRFSLPCTPPDFDGEPPTDPDAVAQYVRGLATAYSSAKRDPTAYQIYHHVMCEVEASLEDNNANNLVAESDLNSHSTSNVNILAAEDEEAPNVDPPLEGEAFSVSMYLSSLDPTRFCGTKQLFRKFQNDWQLATSLSCDVVDDVLRWFSACVTDGALPPAALNEACALAGIIVCRRGRMREMLEYLRTLELLSASSYSILSEPVPHAQLIVDSFSFNVRSAVPVTSPVDCYLGDFTRMQIALREGDSVHAFCVSPNGQRIATATSTGIILFDAGSGAMLAEAQMDEARRKCWNMIFTEDSQRIICTEASGQLHYLLDLELTRLQEELTEEVSIPLDFADGIFHCHPCPGLPAGHVASLFIHQESGGFLTSHPLPAAPGSGAASVEFLTMACLVHRDFAGTIVHIACGGDDLTVGLDNGVVRLQQGASVCHGLVPSLAPWLQLSIRWARGVWFLTVNRVVVELQGMRSGPKKSVEPELIECLHGLGHVGPVGIWVGVQDGAGGQVTLTESRMALWPVRPLLYLPLDEGGGLWVKELVNRSCHTLSESAVAWDAQRSLPHLETPPGATVPKSAAIPLDSRVVLSSRLLTSAFNHYVVVPSTLKGGDDVVLIVDRASNVIRRTYRFPRASNEGLYALLLDESKLFVYQQRFLSFSWVPLATPSNMQLSLTLSGIGPSAHTRHTKEWMLEELYRKMFCESNEFRRFPRGQSPLSMDTLWSLCKLLEGVKAGANCHKVLALTALAQVHFTELDISDPHRLSVVAKALRTSSSHILELFPQKVIQETATRLHEASRTKSLALHDRVSVLINGAAESSAELRRSCLSKTMLCTIVNYVVHSAPREQFLQVAQSLLRQCRQEEQEAGAWRGSGSGGGGGDFVVSGSVAGGASTSSPDPQLQQQQQQPQQQQPVTDAMLWFVLQSHTALRHAKRQDDIAQLLLLLLAHVAEMSDAQLAESPRSVVQTALVPLLIMAARHHTWTTHEAEVEEQLFHLVKRLRAWEDQPPAVVEFSTCEAYDMYPSTRGNAWRFSLDFSRAWRVVVMKDHNAPEVKLLRTDPAKPVSQLYIITPDAAFTQLGGGALLLYGSGENSVTVQASYALSVEASWTRVLRDAAVGLLVARASHLTTKPRGMEAYIAPLLSFGLVPSVLRRRGVVVEGRAEPVVSSFAREILRDEGDGRAFVTQVCQRMRGSVVPSMRPALQALLAVLVHSGVTQQQAEDELRLRWFSGDWGAKLQGAARERTTQVLMDLAVWIVGSAAYQPDYGLGSSRRRTSDRWYDAPMSFSQSLTGGRVAASSRRSSTTRQTIQSDVLDQMRMLLSLEMQPQQLEDVVVERTLAAARIEHGLAILTRVLEVSGRATTEQTMVEVLHVLWQLCGMSSGTHYVECLCGAGPDLEMRVRQELHAALEQCVFVLLDRVPVEVVSQALLFESAGATRGRATMLLYALLCHPWDVVDCELFSSKVGGRGDILRHMNDQMNVLEGNLSLDSPWKVQKKAKPVSDAEEPLMLSETLGAADLSSLSYVFPNNISVSIPLVQTSMADNGISIEMSSLGVRMLRADEGWPLAWRSGVPRVFYYEVTLQSDVSRLQVGLCTLNNDPTQAVRLMSYYENNGTTHNVALPAYFKGDVIGCGIIATSRRLFFTLNGEFVSYAGVVEAGCDVVYPTLCMETTANLKLRVNFGTASLAYDFRQLHPSLSWEKGPTWYRVSSTAEVTLHYLTTRACAVLEQSRRSSKIFLNNCSEVVCRNVNKLASALMQIGVDAPESSDASTRIKQRAIKSMAEQSMIILIASLRHVTGGVGRNGFPLSEVASEMVFDAVSVLMLIPMHSIQIATISLLPEVLPHVRRFEDVGAPLRLLDALFEHANDRTPNGLIPFAPMWCACDQRLVSIENAQTAQMLPEAQRSTVLGGILPRTGVVSFSIQITRRNMSKGHSLKGGYYIGVSVAGQSALSSASGPQNWKMMKPPIAWALHDISPQLPHATNPTVRANNFQRTFGCADVIKIEVNRDARTVDFYRDGEFLQTLFSDIPNDVDLVPFVQLYNDDACARIMEGYMTAPISAPTLLGAASVDVLRAMLTLEPFQAIVADRLCAELRAERYPRVTLAVFRSVPDPRVLQLCRAAREELYITVSRIGDLRCKFSIGAVANYEHIYNLRTPATPHITCALDLPITSLSGIEQCIDELVVAAHRIIAPLTTTQALACLEAKRRAAIVTDERDRWNFLFHGIRVRTFLAIQEASQNKSLLRVPRIPRDYTFSAARAHPSFYFSPHHCGRLGTVLNDSSRVTAPFIAVAEPAVPSHGTFSIRCQLIRGHYGQILGGGYYFGVCSASFNWKRKELESDVPEVWALHDMDGTPWRLSHVHPGATFPVTNDPRCVIMSGDVIRLQINREEGTMYAFRKSLKADEVSLGLIFDNLPAGELYPFVHLFNPDAAAVLLPSNSRDPPIRLPVQQPCNAICLPNPQRSCDSCMTRSPEWNKSSTWFKCNECVDYALCKSCFDLCMHSYHSFTEMGPANRVYTALPPAFLEPGMEVVVPATSCMYLFSSGCSIDERRMNCAVEALDDAAFSVWGIVCKGTTQFTTVISTAGGEPLCADCPTIIGVGEASLVTELLAQDKLRAECLRSPSSIVSYCSDPTLRKTLDHESAFPYGFSKGSRITFDIDVNRGVVTISRDWTVVGTCKMEGAVAAAAAAADGQQQPPTAAAAAPSLAGFVLFGRRGTTASVLAEVEALDVKVETVNGFTATVSREGRMRYVTMDMCRLPLHQMVEQPAHGRLAYTFVGKQMVQCRVLKASKDEAWIHLAGESGPRCVPRSSVLVDKLDAIAEERLMDGGARSEPASTIAEGFVMSRLLLILSCLSENDALSGLVMAHSGRLLDVVADLSAVEVGNDAPMEILDEIRRSVSRTANCVPGSSQSGGRLAAFVPAFVDEERRRRFRPGMLVTSLQDGQTYAVVARMGELLSLQSATRTLRLSHTDCIPVKKCGDQPWFTVPSGLPCSVMEYTARVAPAAVAPDLLAPLDGEWQGEIITADRQSTFLQLHMSGGFGSGHVYLHTGTVPYLLFYEHQRYPRTVRLCLIDQNAVPSLPAPVAGAAATAMSFEARVAALAGWWAASGQPKVPYQGFVPPNPWFVLEADVDAKGLRIGGVCRPRSGLFASFCVNYVNRPPLAALPSKRADIEPLPDCVEAVLPAVPQYCGPTVMHRLIVLLARHLYLVVCTRTGATPDDFVNGPVFVLENHPFTNALVRNLIRAPRLYSMVSEAIRLVLDPGVRPWNVAALARLITHNFLLLPGIADVAPLSLLCDALHAVVVAAHQCGSAYRCRIIRSLTLVAQSCRRISAAVYEDLFATLFAFIDRSLVSSVDFLSSQQDMAAGVDLMLTVHSPLCKSLRNVPLTPLQCVVDISESLRSGRPLPRVVETDHSAATAQREGTLKATCTFGDYVGGALKVGKVMGSRPARVAGKYYYEVTLPSRLTSQFAIGWGTRAHGDVPTQHVGSDVASFAFNGSDVTSKKFKEEYHVISDVTSGCVIGSLINMEERLVAFSINGRIGPFIPIPISGSSFFAYVSIGSCDGLRVKLHAKDFDYGPDGYTDLAGVFTRVQLDSYCPTERSSLPVRPFAFYAQLASYLSALEEQSKDDLPSLANASRSHSMTMLLNPRDQLLAKYPELSSLSQDDVERHARVVTAIESCMATTRRFVNLNDDVVEGALSLAFLHLRPLVRRSFQTKLLVRVPTVEKVTPTQTIVARVTELYSALPRTPEVALRHTILAQMHKQMSGYTLAQWSCAPLFKVLLYISGSGHAPIDLGGPYRQLWTFLADEVTRHPDRCFPHSDFHRNPLFRFVNNSERLCLVPESQAASSYELGLFNFFGKIMGHAARAQIPLDIDFSPFMWKYLVDDPLTVRDYYQYVDSVVEQSMTDDGFITGGVAEELIPGFSAAIEALGEGDGDADVGPTAQRLRGLAEQCLLHSLDAQLSAIRRGLWEVLPRQVVRCLSWVDLERLVGGESNPSVAEMKNHIITQLSESREKWFWKIVEGMGGEEKAALLCFASGQKRLPLVRPITVIENTESIDHLPRAQSCSSHIMTPAYTSFEMFREKLLLALQHQMEMELA